MAALKIGVLTFHRCINYGSYWQSLCLVEGLRARGHEAVLLDHHSRRVNMAEWKCALQPVLPTPVPKTDHMLYREKLLKFFQIFDTLPLSPPFQIDNPSEMENYDAVVVGSDEVWNLFHPWYGRQPLFYGDGLRTEHLVSYAASFGNYNASWGLEKTWADKLRNFASISVRDENSRIIVNQATGIEPEIVLDPFLQFPLELKEKDTDNSKKPYVAVYGHNFSGAFARKVRSWSEKKNLPLISIGYRNDWADEQWITADPVDFAHFIADSRAVATNFFHGCVFSLRYEKPFVCESSPYRGNKLHGLMEKIGGMEHLLTEDRPESVFDARLREPLDPAILNKIGLLRKTSNAYLDRALEIKQFQTA